MKFYQNWSVAAKKSESEDFGAYFSAEVPGNVQWDYAKANLKEDLMFADNVKFFNELEDFQWKYRTELDFKAEPDEKVFFVSEGIDYIFDILLNGEVIHSQEGMYTKVEIDITDKVKNGSVLEVIIHQHPKRKGATSCSREEADRSCKPPVTYGWDWNPRLLISGIWMPTYIETRKKDYIANCELFYTLNDDRTAAEMHFETVCDGDVVYTVYDKDNKIVYSGTDFDFTLNDIDLWWCNGQGEPNLYYWTAKSGSDEKSGHIGLRTVRLVHNEGADNVKGFPKGRYPSPITIELNGRRIFAKGSNWVNPELFFGRIKENTYKELVFLAKDANMNIFRCWGGAGINKPAFYEECDKNGIMVWQEFMLACNNYSGQGHYLEILEQEATSIIKSLRKYPSVVLWCGGNELFNNWSGMDEQSYSLRMLNKLCFEFDRSTPFLMTSPEFGMAHGGYMFRDVEQEGKDVMQMFNSSFNTAYTEFGVPSITDVESLKKIIPEKELFPIEKTPSWEIHHGFGAWRKECWVCSDVLNHYFGEDDSLEERVYHSNWLQCAGYKAIFEEARRQWKHCSAAINWCFNEPWITAAGNSLITYPFKPKPAYYAVKASLRTSLISARIPKFDWNGGENFTAELWYLNDGVSDVSDTVTVSVKLGEEKFKLLVWETGVVEANNNKLGPAINFKLPMSAQSNVLELILESENNNGSEYALLFKNGKKTVKSLMMNI